MTCDVCNLDRPTQPVTDRSGLIRCACSECAGVIGGRAAPLTQANAALQVENAELQMLLDCVATIQRDSNAALRDELAQISAQCAEALTEWNRAALDRTTLKAALREACDLLDQYGDYPIDVAARIAELRALAEDA